MRKAVIVALGFYVGFVLMMIGVADLWACDTWVAMPDATASGMTILAKNSDRTAAGCAPLALHPRSEWPAGSEIDLGRVRIPQAPRTWATVGSHPYWCWGYEEGMNEHGVAIGNEGVFSKELVLALAAAVRDEGPEPGPTGMDLVRIGLERGRTAREALEAIVAVLEAHGQFGSGIPGLTLAQGAYENSFIIADPGEAWILETAGRRWAARRVERGTASISNAYTIGDDYDLAADDLAGRAAAMGWWDEDAGPVDFAGAYADDSIESRRRTRHARTREECSAGLLGERAGSVDEGWMMRIARDRSTNPSIDLDVTASSCVASLPAGRGTIPVFWWCASVPSTSVYIPFFAHADRLPEIVGRAGTAGVAVTPPERAAIDRFAGNSYWWLVRDLADLVAADRNGRLPVVRERFDALEASFADGLAAVLSKAGRLRARGSGEKAAAVLGDYSAACVDRAVAAVGELRARFAAEAAETDAAFAPLVGIYTANFGAFRNAEFEVLERNDQLAVDIPGQMTVELNDPGPDGRRSIALAPHVSFSFDRGEDGRVTAMHLYEVTTLGRAAADSAAIAAGSPFASYTGTYAVPGAGGLVGIVEKDGGMALDVPGQGAVPLGEADGAGRRPFRNDPSTVAWFETGDDGGATDLVISHDFILPRGRSAAAALEAAIGESGIEAGIARYRELRETAAEEYHFSERSLNVLGYTLLRDGKTGEAVAVFELNAEEHPGSWNVWDSLAEALEEAGDGKRAVECYRKSLSLNPERGETRTAIERLEKGE